VYDIAVRVARVKAKHRWGRAPTFAHDLIYALLHRIVFAPLLRQLGFDRLELVVSGGAPLPTDTMALWHVYGVNVVGMYGQTEEAGGIVAGPRGALPRAGARRAPPGGCGGRAARRGA